MGDVLTMVGVIGVVVVFAAIVYSICTFFFHAGGDFAAAIVAFWAGFIFTMKERGEPIVKNADVLSKFCFILALLFTVRGFFAK